MGDAHEATQRDLGENRSVREQAFQKQIAEWFGQDFFLHRMVYPKNKFLKPLGLSEKRTTNVEDHATSGNLRCLFELWVGCRVEFLEEQAFKDVQAKAIITAKGWSKIVENHEWAFLQCDLVRGKEPIYIANGRILSNRQKLS